MIPRLPPFSRSALLALGPAARLDAARRLVRALPLPVPLEQELVDEVRRCWDGVPLPRTLPQIIDDARAIATLAAIERHGAWADGPHVAGRHMTIGSLIPIEQAMAKSGAGVILATAAFGAWQHIAPAVARRGYKVGLLDLRPPGRRDTDWPAPGPGLDLRVLPSTGYARPIVRFATEERGVVVVLADESCTAHYASGALLGRSASVGASPFEIARRAELQIVPVFAVRERTGHVLQVEEPIKIFDTGHGAADLDATASRFLRLLDRHARRRPEHYLPSLLIRHASRYDDPTPLFADAITGGEQRRAV